jgi:hypothetical protein
LVNSAPTKAIFASSTVFYVGDNFHTLNTNIAATPTLAIHATNDHGVILSSDSNVVCYQMSTAAASAPVTMTAVSMSSAASPFITVSITFTAYTTSVLVALDPNKITPKPTSCVIPQFTLSATQTTTSFSYVAGQCLSFSMTPYTATENCGFQSPVYTYTNLNLSDSLPLNPVTDFVSFDPVATKFSLSANSASGTYSVSIIGTMPNSQNINSIFTFTGSASPTGNLPAKFS